MEIGSKIVMYWIWKTMSVNILNIGYRWMWWSKTDLSGGRVFGATTVCPNLREAQRIMVPYTTLTNEDSNCSFTIHRTHTMDNVGLSTGHSSTTGWDSAKK